MKTKLDGIVDTLAGLGGSTASWQRSAPITSAVLDEYANIFDTSWLARRIVELLPRTAVAAGFTVQGSKDKAALLAAFGSMNQDPLNPDGYFLSAAIQGRLFGGASLLLGYSGSEPLELPPGTGEALEWFDLLRWTDLQIARTNTDIGTREQGRPTVLRVTDHATRRGLSLHADRLLWFPGDPSYDRARLRTNALARWVPVLRVCEDVIARHGMTWNAVDVMVKRASIHALTIKGLIDALASEDSRELERRAELLRVTMSTAKVMFLDSDGGEKLEAISTSFADLPQLIQQSALETAGAAGIPASILFGQSAAGLNATGESDLAQWSASVDSYGTNVLAPRMAAILSEIEGAPVNVTWNPSRKAKPAEIETLRAVRLKTDRDLYEQGILELNEIIAQRHADGTLGVDFDLSAKLLELAKGNDSKSARFEITPSDQSLIVTVNEARESSGLPSLGEQGNVSIFAARARAEAMANAEADATVKS